MFPSTTKQCIAHYKYSTEEQSCIRSRERRVETLLDRTLTVHGEVPPRLYTESKFVEKTKLRLGAPIGRGNANVLSDGQYFIILHEGAVEFHATAASFVDSEDSLMTCSGIEYYTTERQNLFIPEDDVVGFEGKLLRIVLSSGAALYAWKSGSLPTNVKVVTASELLTDIEILKSQYVNWVSDMGSTLNKVPLHWYMKLYKGGEYVKQLLHGLPLEDQRVVRLALDELYPPVDQSSVMQRGWLANRVDTFLAHGMKSTNVIRALQDAAVKKYAESKLMSESLDEAEVHKFEDQRNILESLKDQLHQQGSSELTMDQLLLAWQMMSEIGAANINGRTLNETSLEVTSYEKTITFSDGMQRTTVDVMYCASILALPGEMASFHNAEIDRAIAASHTSYNLQPTLIPATLRHYMPSASSRGILAIGESNCEPVNSRINGRIYLLGGESPGDDEYSAQLNNIILHAHISGVVNAGAASFTPIRGSSRADILEKGANFLNSVEGGDCMYIPKKDNPYTPDGLSAILGQAAEIIAGRVSNVSAVHVSEFLEHGGTLVVQKKCRICTLTKTYAFGLHWSVDTSLMTKGEALMALYGNSAKASQAQITTHIFRTGVMHPAVTPATIRPPTVAQSPVHAKLEKLKEMLRLSRESTPVKIDSTTACVEVGNPVHIECTTGSQSGGHSSPHDADTMSLASTQTPVSLQGQGEYVYTDYGAARNVYDSTHGKIEKGSFKKESGPPRSGQTPSMGGRVRSALFAEVRQDAESRSSDGSHNSNEPGLKMAFDESPIGRRSRNNSFTSSNSSSSGTVVSGAVKRVVFEPNEDSQLRYRGTPPSETPSNFTLKTRNGPVDFRGIGNSLPFQLLEKDSQTTLMKILIAAKSGLASGDIHTEFAGCFKGTRLAQDIVRQDECLNIQIPTWCSVPMSTNIDLDTLYPDGIPRSVYEWVHNGCV
jgi:hypothetical protein